jgi:c-di-GMP-binding flagellar brake protein YcgR
MEQTFSKTERRVDKRVRMNCTVIYRMNEPLYARFMMKGEDIEAKMVDISQGGMAMVTSYDIPIATILSMRFTVLKVSKEIVNFSGPVEITGEVRSNIPSSRDGHRLGIYFTKMRKVNVA